MDIAHYLLTAAADIGAPTAAQPPGTDGLTTLLGWLLWIVSFAGVIGVLVVAAMMMFAHRRGEGSETASKLGIVLGGCILAAAAAPLVNVIL